MNQSGEGTLLMMKHDPFEGINSRPVGKALSKPLLALLWVLLAAYAPLLALTALENTFSSGVVLTFLGDFGAQARFLAAVPLLIISRPAINVATSSVCIYIHDVLLDKEERERVFLPALRQIRELNESILGRTLVVLLVFIITALLYYHDITDPELSSVTSWYGYIEGGEFHSSNAYLWYNLVSMSIFRFILLRWLWSYCCWVYLLTKVAGCRLRLTPHHGDKAAGLNLLVFPQTRYNLLYVSLAITSSGVLINDIIYRNQNLESVMPEVLILISISFVMLLGPYLLYMPKLVKIKREAHLSMAKKSHQLSEDYDRVWIHTKAAGLNDYEKPDPSTMIDYYSTFEISEKIRTFVFDMRDLAALAIPIAIAYLPVLLTKMSVKEVLQIILRIVA